jgi:hypothetical protein
MPRNSLVPDQRQSGTVHMVLEDFGRSGRAWIETDENETDERDIVDAIIDGQFKRPIKIAAFNLDEGWARDVTEDIARAVIDKATAEHRRLGRSAAEFVERATGKDVPADLVVTT